jgi:hypothetical protein
MKKVLFTVLAGVLAGMTFAPALAADDEKMFTFNGEVRARYEYLNNYLDLADNDSGATAFDDQMGITPYRVMVGITGNFEKNVSAHVDLQYTGHFGDTFNPSSDNPFFLPFPTPVGQADAAYQFATQGVHLYQGYVDIGKIGGSDFGIRIGRQEHTYGTELFMGDNDYYNGLAFDGIRGMWKHGSSDLNVFYYKISEENCFFGCFTGNGFGPGASADSNLWGATYDFNFKTWGTVGGEALIAQDLGGDGPEGFPDSKVMTYGVRWNRGMMNDDKLNMFDWNIEVAAQTGDEGDPFGGPSIDISTWVLEGWFAFNFNAGNSHGRVHIGTLMTSGNEFAGTEEKDFFTLYGDFHANNRFGDLDWEDTLLGGPHNITDFNVGYEHWFGDAHYVMLAYHMFATTESDPGAEDKIGDEIDVKYGYRYSKNLSFEVSFGQMMPDDTFWTTVEAPPFGNGPTIDPVQRATFMAKLGW